MRTLFAVAPVMRPSRTCSVSEIVIWITL
jgi:hypothetical protein